MIYLSTGLIDNKKTSFEVSRELIKNGVHNIEFSAGKFLKDQYKRIAKLKRNNCNFLIHNYYPPSKKVL